MELPLEVVAGLKDINSTGVTVSGDLPEYWGVEFENLAPFQFRDGWNYDDRWEDSEPHTLERDKRRDRVKSRRLLKRLGPMKLLGPGTPMLRKTLHHRVFRPNKRTVHDIPTLKQEFRGERPSFTQAWMPEYQSEILERQKYRLISAMGLLIDDEWLLDDHKGVYLATTRGSRRHAKEAFLMIKKITGLDMCTIERTFLLDLEWSKPDYDLTHSIERLIFAPERTHSIGICHNAKGEQSRVFSDKERWNVRPWPGSYELVDCVEEILEAYADERGFELDVMNPNIRDPLTIATKNLKALANSYARRYNWRTDHFEQYPVQEDDRKKACDKQSQDYSGILIARFYLDEYVDTLLDKKIRADKVEEAMIDDSMGYGPGPGYSKDFIEKVPVAEVEIRHHTRFNAFYFPKFEIYQILASGVPIHRVAVPLKDMLAVEDSNLSGRRRCKTGKKAKYGRVQSRVDC